MRLRFLRPVAWFCIVLLAVLSWLPGDEMVRTGIDTHIEHFTAYFGTMLVIALAYASEIGLPRPTLLLIAYAGILELGQNFSPGRHPAIVDFAASSLGAIVGSLAGLLACRVLLRLRRV
jgi:VanZ family protein